MERASKEMTTLHDDGVYYALNNEEEQEYSLSHQSPKVLEKKNSSPEYVIFYTYVAMYTAHLYSTKLTLQ